VISLQSAIYYLEVIFVGNLLCFLAKVSMEFRLLLCLPADYRKFTDSQSFSAELQLKKAYHVRELKPQPCPPLHPFSLDEKQKLLSAQISFETRSDCIRYQKLWNMHLKKY
jgi:hypothetical protein